MTSEENHQVTLSVSFVQAIDKRKWIKRLKRLTRRAMSVICHYACECVWSVYDGLISILSSCQGASLPGELS